MCNEFIDAYFGKVYPPSPDDKPLYTEIKSLGLEYLAAAPEKLAQDPDNFDFIYTVLRNPSAARAEQERLLARAKQELTCKKPV